MTVFNSSLAADKIASKSSPQIRIFLRSSHLSVECAHSLGPSFSTLAAKTIRSGRSFQAIPFLVTMNELNKLYVIAVQCTSNVMVLNRQSCLHSFIFNCSRFLVNELFANISLYNLMSFIQIIVEMALII